MCLSQDLEYDTIKSIVIFDIFMYPHRIQPETWYLLTHKSNNFLSSLCRMFESKPELLELFANFRDHGLGDLKKNGLLRQHALRVMATVDKCITRIDEPEAFIELLFDVGVSHKKYKVPSEYIQVINISSQC